MPTCPYCGDTRQYTDPLLNVRCTRCFNHVAGTATTPIGAVQDLDAPMTIGTHVYPGAFTHYDLHG